ARALPFRSNIPKIAEFSFDVVDPTYHERARALGRGGGHAVVGGANYGQGSSREHAALAPGFFGLRAVIAKGFARIHEQNLVNFGILPLRFENPDEYGSMEPGDRLALEDLKGQIRTGRVMVQNATRGKSIRCVANLSPRQIEVILEGGL